MPESIERIIRGFSVLRLLSIATLLLIVACLIVSATIALADVPETSKSGISDQLDISAAERAGPDVYEFDFEIEIRPNAELDEFIPN